MLSVLAMAVGAPVSDAPFPLYPSQFTMTESIWMNVSPDDAPNIKREFIWDTSAKRSWYQVNNTAPPPHAGQGKFELQLRRCDTSTQKYYDITGDPAADPSTYGCQLISGPQISQCASWQPFWTVPKGPVWNGTASINGVMCDRFELANPLGRQTFWGTPTAPCRSVVSHANPAPVPSTHEQEDYTTFVPEVPPVAAFALPSWVAGLKCGGGPPGDTEQNPPRQPQSPW